MEGSYHFLNWIKRQTGRDPTEYWTDSKHLIRAEFLLQSRRQAPHLSPPVSNVFLPAWQVNMANPVPASLIEYLSASLLQGEQQIF